MSSTVKTFSVEVEGIGPFVFRRRSMRDEFRIEAEVSRLTEGVATPTANLLAMANVVAPVKVLCVEAPKNWNIDELDPFDEESYKRIAAVHTALATKEKLFRAGNAKAGADAGAGGQPNG